MEVFPFVLPMPVMFGEGTANNVGFYAKNLNCSKVLILCDEGIKKAGIAEKIISAVKAANLDYALNSSVVADPTDVSIDAIADFAKAEKVDGILAVGGGSTIDSAKCVKFLLCHEGKLNQYFGYYPGDDTGIPLIAVPTTAGTGSEVTIGAVVTDTNTNTKLSVANMFVKTAMAVVDPELTVGCPKRITAACAFDVLSHAIDGCTSNHTSALTQNVIHNAISLFMGSYKEVYVNGSNIKARSDMHLASVIGGIAILNGYVQATHSFAHTLGARYHVVHGAACAMFIGPCLEYVAEIWPEEVKTIAKLLEVDFDGVEDVNTIARLTSSKIHKMAKEVDLPDITEVCPDEVEAAKELIPTVLNDALRIYCPREMDADGAAWILHRAYELAGE